MSDRSSQSVHEKAAVGFDRAGNAYEHGRPGYPDEVLNNLIHHLGVTPSSHVGELGAGTGKFTRVLLQTGANITAIEPVDGMRAKLEGLSSRVVIRAGTAERIPAGDGTFDFVIAAQAAHWFDEVLAPAEIHRVLKTGGRLALVWNIRDESQRIFASLNKLMEKYEGTTPRYKTMRWKVAFEQSNLFTPFEVFEFAHAHIVDVEAAVDRIGSVSFISALPDEERARALMEVRQIIESHPDTGGQREFALRYVTRLYTCTKVG